MIRRPPRSTLDRSSAASDVYKRQVVRGVAIRADGEDRSALVEAQDLDVGLGLGDDVGLSLIHISEPTRPY